jgi:hypothetical protein
MLRPRNSEILPRYHLPIESKSICMPFPCFYTNSPLPDLTTTDDSRKHFPMSQPVVACSLFSLSRWRFSSALSLSFLILSFLSRRSFLCPHVEASSSEALNFAAGRDHSPVSPFVSCPTRHNIFFPLSLSGRHLLQRIIPCGIQFLSSLDILKSSPLFPQCIFPVVL